MTAGDDVDRDLSEVCLLLRTLTDMLEALRSDLLEMARAIQKGTSGGEEAQEEVLT